MKNRTVITLAALAVLAVLASFTALNKRWWGRRIVARYDVTTGNTPGDPWTIHGPDWTKWSIPQLIQAWREGRPGWYAKGERPDLATTTEFDVQ